MVIHPHVGPKGTFTCHVGCSEHALEWWNNVSPLYFNVIFHRVMETWMLVGALSPICTHILPIPHWWLLHHHCCALGGSQDNGFVVWVCRCGDCLWAHMFCQWTQRLKRFCTQGHRWRVCSPRYSNHVLYLHLQQCLGLLFCQWTQGLRGVAPEATEEEFVVRYSHPCTISASAAVFGFICPGWHLNVIAVTADASLIGCPKCFVAENQNNKQ
jgi:hypothetical protein